MTNRRRHIFVAPLDWGLGHATRCIPIIRELLRQGAKVTVGASGRQATLLEGAFRGIDIIDFPGYKISYPSEGSMAWSMLKQLPGIAASIKSERRLLEKLAVELSLDGVISDNRFGLYHHALKSIYMTHQVQIMAPENQAWLEPILRRVHRSYIDRFDDLWIPDHESMPNLSGLLSHDLDLPDHAHYIGPLTRLKPPAKPVEKDIDLLVMLSGPEPQRTILEDKIISQLAEFSKSAVIFRGLPGGGAPIVAPENATVYDSPDSDDIASHISRSKVILCRPGYSTLMELAAFGSRALVIPTPGQTEQEYLADYHGKAGHYAATSQDSLNLKADYRRAANCSGIKINYSDKNLSSRVKNLLA